MGHFIVVSYDLRQVIISSYIIESSDTLVVMVLHPSCVDNPFSHYWKYAVFPSRMTWDQDLTYFPLSDTHIIMAEELMF